MVAGEGGGLETLEGDECFVHSIPEGRLWGAGVSKVIVGGDC